MTAEHKHNIGPWYASAHRIRDEASDAIVATIEDGGHVENEIFSSADRKKHARLIAAAPDMLEALRNIVGSLESKGAWKVANALKLAKTAIAKAEGQS